MTGSRREGNAAPQPSATRPTRVSLDNVKAEPRPVAVTARDGHLVILARIEGE